VTLTSDFLFVQILTIYSTYEYIIATNFENTDYPFIGYGAFCAWAL